ncbi:MAG: serine/threonine-protein kinase [Nocardioides sp.]
MPARLGRYAVRRRIGSGGFATVWLAYDEQLDSPVAIKVLADNWTEDHHVRGRFLEEGRYLRKVESPHVVTVYDAGELEDGRPYLVMSYADQGTLADRLEVEGLTPAQALEVVRQVGAGLQALHDRHVLHRDVKPANVLFRTVDTGSPEVRAMVGDLGLGKALDMSSRLTMIAGTPSFVAPEQAQGEPLDARADQYSLAALTYLMLAGRPPYAHASLAAAADPGPPPPLSTPDRRFPEDVDAVVRRGLAPDREERWPDVQSYVAALTAALDHDGRTATPAPWLPVDPALTQPGARPSQRHVSGAPLPDPTPPPRPRRRGRRALAAVAGLVVLAAGAAAGWLADHEQAAADVTLSDDGGSLRVTVPASWHRAVGDRGWRSPLDQTKYAALSVGTSPTWNRPESHGQGVFLGILAGTKLPEQVPQHPECRAAASPVLDDGSLGSSVTVVYTRCPDGVTVERVVQVAANRLLWVQVRSADRATANAVLDSVETPGF